ncbi:MAG: LacI family transcriptional regulator [bacterium]|nr:LacI family transcriptional regulator [bacterium]
MKREKVTIKEIAKRAGVSPATVSLVLSRKGNIKEETRNKVLAVTKELGYITSRSFYEEVLIGSKLISLIAFIDGTHPSGRFYLPLIQGVTDKLKEEGYKVTVDIVGELAQDKRELRKKYLKEFEKDQKNIAGILILSTWAIGLEEVIPFIEENKPVIFLDTKMPEINKNFVLIDHYKGAFDAVEYLIKLGHRNIAHISGTKGHPHTEARLKGYLDALKAYNIPIKDEYIIEGDFNNLDLVIANMQRVLKLKPLPTAIFGANDNITITSMNFLKSKGVSVPDDISFIGFDNTHSSSLSDPPLTTISQPLYEVGKEGASMLLNLLETKKLFTEPRILRAELIIRKSTTAPKEVKAKI